MSTREHLLAQSLVAPGEAARLAERDPGSTGGPEFAALAQEDLEERAKDAIARGIAELSEAQECGRQGLGDQARDVRREPARLPGIQLQTSERRRTGT
jgi:hypothetical protein